tara:strand:+ start:450 stop:818 length:369 start_codon:yes stop_codon:yes gene_type:complete
VTDSKAVLGPNFEAALSREDMEDAELRHVDIEHLRKISMLAGLTLSSKELESSCNTDTKAFHDALVHGIQAIEHYRNLAELLENSVLRIYSIAANHSTWENNEELEEKMTALLSTSMNENQH